MVGDASPLHMMIQVVSMSDVGADETYVVFGVKLADRIIWSHKFYDVDFHEQGWMDAYIRRTENLFANKLSEVLNA